MTRGVIVTRHAWIMARLIQRPIMPASRVGGASNLSVNGTSESLEPVGRGFDWGLGGQKHKVL